MGNGASSSQGGLPANDKRDIRSSVEEEQHDWQPEQAVAPKPETLSLQSTRKSYILTGFMTKNISFSRVVSAHHNNNNNNNNNNTIYQFI